MNPNRDLAGAFLALRNIFLAVAVFSFFVNSLMLMPSLYMMQVYDRVLASRNLTTLWLLTALVLGMYVLLGALEWVRSRLLMHASARLEEDLNEKVYTAAFEANLRRLGSDPRQAIADLTNLRQFFSGAGLIAFMDAPWSPIYLACIFILHPLLGWLSLAGMGLLVTLTLVTEWATKKPLSAAGAHAIRASTLANNQLANAEVIQAMGMLPALRQRWRAQHERTLAFQVLASDRAGLINAVTRFVRVSLQSLMLGLGAYCVIVDGLSPGAMIAASILMGRALAPVEALIGAWRGVVGARGAWRRLAELLRLLPDAREKLALPAPRGAVQIEAATVVPPGGKQAVLAGVTLELPAGECVVVIGPTGAGKSSLARLIVGVWSPAAGKVRLDGADLDGWDKAQLGPSLGYLPQEIELFAGTIAENIARFGSIDSPRVVEAAQRAGIHEMVLRLPQGYDTPIGPGGDVLSGGQRQRVALARALYGDPVLLVLDEPNANLDDTGEAALLRAVLEMKGRGKTIVIVSHRTNIVGAADRLLLLREGAVQTYGPRDEVLKLMRGAAQRAQSGPPPLTSAGGHV